MLSNSGAKTCASSVAKTTAPSGPPAVVNSTASPPVSNPQITRPASVAPEVTGSAER